MPEAQPGRTGGPAPVGAHMVVTLQPDGRYCVAYTDGAISRRSYTSSVEQVVRQAQRAGGIPVRTDDEVLRTQCRAAAVPLLEEESAAG
jgi:hypothetical protein